MRIETHPKPDGMQHVNLMFCEEGPDPEDLWIRARIQEFPVPPKRILEWERDGRRYTVLQFGQCVIGHAMFDIEKHKSVVDKIRDFCRADLELAAREAEQEAAFERDTLLAVIAGTALEFHKQARYTVDASGELAIDLDESHVRERILQRLEEERTHSPDGRTCIGETMAEGLIDWVKE
jgi:hypothetical protein